MSTRKYLAFDIEIANPLPEGIEDWTSARPLGISCAATLSGDGSTTIFHGKTPSGEISDQMDQSESKQIVEHLSKAIDSGFTILT